jgi:hypothetical protein
MLTKQVFALFFFGTCDVCCMSRFDLKKYDDLFLGTRGERHLTVYK